MTMKHTVSSWFKVFHDHVSSWLFHDHETNCFIADSSWFNMFHHCFIALIHPVSCWFNLIHHCFITVSSLFHHCFTSGNEPLRRRPLYTHPSNILLPINRLLKAKTSRNLYRVKVLLLLIHCCNRHEYVRNFKFVFPFQQ